MVQHTESEDDDDNALVQHAEHELGFVLGDDEMDQMMRDNVMQLVRVFMAQGHSGFSAHRCLWLFEKVARFEPAAPLTGAENEWAEPFGPDGTQQNRRMGSVFRDKDGRAYHIYAYAFRDRGERSAWQGYYSLRYIKFPFTGPQKSEIVTRPSLRYALIVAVSKINKWFGASFAV